MRTAVSISPTSRRCSACSGRNLPAARPVLNQATLVRALGSGFVAEPRTNFGSRAGKSQLVAHRSETRASCISDTGSTLQFVERHWSIRARGDVGRKVVFWPSRRPALHHAASRRHQLHRVGRSGCIACDLRCLNIKGGRTMKRINYIWPFAALLLNTGEARGETASLKPSRPHHPRVHRRCGL